MASPTPSRPLRVAVLCLLAGVLAPWAAGEGEGEAPRPAPCESARRDFLDHLERAEWAELCFLEYVGWRIVEDPGSEAVNAYAGRPCRHESIEAARAAGALQIRVPPDLTKQQVRAFAPRLAPLALSSGSRAAYKHRIDAAVKAATEKLAAAAEGGRYGFPELFGITFPTFQCKPPRPEWQEYDTGRLWCARGKPSAAIEAIYGKTSVIECYVAQWIAAYAVQYELYGAKWFDRTFRPEEITIGTSRAIRETPFGAYLELERAHPYTALLIPASAQEGSASRYLLGVGRKAFAGLGGIVKCEILGMNAFENITIVSMSEACADVLRERGGFGWYEERAREIWEAYDEISGLFVQARYKARREKEIDRMLADPAFAELLVYVHPYGVLSVAELAREKMEKGSTPISVSLYTHGREDAFYRRFHEAVLERCLGAGLRPGRAQARPPR